MHIDLAGSTRPLTDVSDGALCITKWRERPVFAIKCSRNRNGEYVQFAAILGPGSGAERAPHIKSLRALDVAHALELENVCLVPNTAPDFLTLGWADEWQAGEIAISGSDAYLFADGHDGVTAVNLSTGHITPEARQLPARPPALAYTRSWNIVRTAGDKQHEIFRFEVPALGARPEG